MNYFFTHALNDQTDEISISFRGVSHTLNHHRPFIKQRYYDSFDFIDQIIEGYGFAYDYITDCSSLILSNNPWWQKVANVRSRIILRDTAAYMLLLRSIQQPQYCCSKDKAKGFLRKKLGTSPFSEYEIEDLIESNIPYFFQLPGEKNIYDGRGHCYAYTTTTAIDLMRHQFLNRSMKKKKADCDLLCKHLLKNITISS